MRFNPPQLGLLALLALLASSRVYGCQPNDLTSSENFTRCHKEAEAGVASAQYTLAMIYQKGEAVVRNPEQALHWYTRAAEQGLVAAQYALAVLYHAGEIVGRDAKQAIDWYTRAAEAGDLKAQHSLGLIYEQGLLVEQNYPQAVRWYILAAEKGVSGDQFALGEIYRHGHEGVPKNGALAQQWYRLAAQQKHGEALYQLGLLSSEGVAVAADPVLGYLYFTLAAQLSHPAATRKRDELRSELTAQQLAEVERRLAAWRWSR